MPKGLSTQNHYKTKNKCSCPKNNFTIKRNMKIIYMSFYKLLFGDS